MPSQASDSGVSPQGQVPWLAVIPPEIRSPILSSLTNRDRKSLRLTCKVFEKITPLYLSRVFLSANPLDIEVLHAVADHPKFRRQVAEIIWDDARFITTPPPSEDEWYAMIERRIQTPSPQPPKLDPEYNCPRWFVKGCKENIDFMGQRKSFDRDHPHHIARQKQVDAQMSLRDCWDYYQKLLQQQDETISSQRDENAFIYGLHQFPALKRVTVTPAAHGWLYTPLYETPTIRSLPYGFNYPIPRGWPGAGFLEMYPDPILWSEAPEAYKEQWHGVRIAIRILTQHKHNVSELSFDTVSLSTGINYTMLEQPCDEYDHFLAIMKRPGFSHLDLPLFVGGTGTYAWAERSSGYLYRALSEAKDLKHMSLSTTIEPGHMGPPILLKNVFPVEHWLGLRHFCLFRFDAPQSDVLSLLKLLPRTLRSVELGLLDFEYGVGCWNDLLEAMRTELHWSDETMRPTVRIIMQGYERMIGRGVWLEDEVNEFLYGLGENPMLGQDPVTYSSQILHDLTWIHENFQN